MAKKKFDIGEYGRKIQAEARKIKKVHKNIAHKEAIKMAAKKLKKK
jgi:hypothetical protein